MKHYDLSVKNKFIDQIISDFFKKMGMKNINEFKKYSFKLILVETHQFNSYTKQETSKIHALLKSKNYNFLRYLGETSIYENTDWKN